MLSVLPMEDASILASSINCLLRDNEFEDLDDICSYYDVERSLVESKLASASYSYSEELNKVI